MVSTPRFLGALSMRIGRDLKKWGKMEKVLIFIANTGMATARANIKYDFYKL